MSGERCHGCGRPADWVAVSYDGGMTSKHECVRMDCRVTQPAPHTPPETRSRAGDTEEDDRE